MAIQPKHMKRAAEYLRCSTDNQPDSIDEQRKSIERFAEQEGFVITATYADQARSGTRASGRPQFLRMISDAKLPNRTFDYVVVLDVSRFSRGDPDEAAYYRHLIKRQGVELVYVTEGFGQDENSQILLAVKQLQVRGEVKDTSLKTISKQVSRIQQGWRPGGMPPFGYDLQYLDSVGKFIRAVRYLETGEKQILDEDGNVTRVLAKGDKLSKFTSEGTKLMLSSPERVELVRRMFDMYINGALGFKQIAARLNNEKVPSPRNGNWSASMMPGWSLSTIRGIITNPNYTGTLYWNLRSEGEFHRISDGQAVKRKPKRAGKKNRDWNDPSDWIVQPDSHPAIIDKATYDEAQRLREFRSRRKQGAPYTSGRAKSSPYLLGGLIKCARCGHKYHGRTINSTKYRLSGERIKTLYYGCGGAISRGRKHCTPRLVRKEPIEAAILDQIGIRVEGFMSGGGSKVLRRLLKRALGVQTHSSYDRAKTAKQKLDEIERKIDRLMDSLTPINKEFVDQKLVKLKEERELLESELDEQKVICPKPSNINGLADDILGQIGSFHEVFTEGTLEEKKEFIQLFVEGIELDAEEERAVLHIREFPAPLDFSTGNSAFDMVAGAGFEPATFGLCIPLQLSLP